MFLINIIFRWPNLYIGLNSATDAQVKPGPLRRSHLVINDMHRGFTFEVIEGEGFGLSIRLEDEFRACGNVQTEVSGTLKLVHQQGPALLYDSNAEALSTDIQLENGLAHLSLTAPTPWRASLPQWPPAQLTTATYRLLVSTSVFRIENNVFLDTFIQKLFLYIIKINNFRGDITNLSSWGKTTVTGVPPVQWYCFQNQIKCFWDTSTLAT